MTSTVTAFEECMDTDVPEPGLNRTITLVIMSAETVILPSNVQLSGGGDAWSQIMADGGAVIPKSEKSLSIMRK